MTARAGMVVFLVGALALYALPLVIGTLALRFAIEVLYLGLLALSFNLVFGYGGLLPFGFNATFGLGAYAFAIALADAPQLGPWGASAIAIAIGALGGLIIGALCVRLHGGYFSLLTLAFAQFLYAIALKWRAVTKGEDGIIVAASALPLPGLGSVRLDVEANMYWFALTVVLVCLALMWRFTRTPLGGAVLLTRENSERAEFLGYNVYATKVIVYTFASTIAAVSGVLFAIFQRLVSPSVLGLGQAGDMLFMTVLGGSGSLLGPMLGALTFQLLQDWLSKVSEHWQFFIGLLFVLLVIFAPAGMTGLLQRVLGRRSKEQIPLTGVEMDPRGEVAR